MKSFRLIDPLQQWITSELSDLGVPVTSSAKLAQSIKRMADYYQSAPLAQTPWGESWCDQAQIAYYFPLNFIRNVRLFNQLEGLNFFNGNVIWYEFGGGLSPSIEAFIEVNGSSGLLDKNIFITDNSAKPLSKLGKRLLTHHNLNLVPSKNLKPSPNGQSLLVMSYSLTEVSNFPEWAWSFDKIVIIEPSTQEDGRKLMALREKALGRGFRVVAPCTHQDLCPLLTKSKRDWCHDRVAFEQPAWFSAIESFLPFKNKTLTLSYLVLEKSKPLLVSNSSNQFVRVVGDQLLEKGKSRQLICRSSDREFLSFLKKDWPTPPELFRGDTVLIDEPIVKRGDELRIAPEQIQLIQR